jgi:hypothetical protein
MSGMQVKNNKFSESFRRKWKVGLILNSQPNGQFQKFQVLIGQKCRLLHTLSERPNKLCKKPLDKLLKRALSSSKPSCPQNFVSVGAPRFELILFSWRGLYSLSFVPWYDMHIVFSCRLFCARLTVFVNLLQVFTLLSIAVSFKFMDLI